MSKVNMSEEAKAAMTEHGWDTGVVAFGYALSEAAVKLTTASEVSSKDFTWISVSFDDSPLVSTDDMEADKYTTGAKQSLGVQSELYKIITDGASVMPVLAIDGQMYTESDQIVLMLAEQDDAPKEVIDLIQLAIDTSEENCQALKHWGWSDFHKSIGYAMVNEDHYSSYGQGTQDAEWEEDVIKSVKAFFDKLESVLAEKDSVNGYYVGDSLTFADCALLNVPQSLSGVTGLDLAKHYPKVQANFDAIKANPPAMSQQFLFGVPFFYPMITGGNKEAREDGHDINKYWT